MIQRHLLPHSVLRHRQNRSLPLAREIRPRSNHRCEPSRCRGSRESSAVRRRLGLGGNVLAEQSSWALFVLLDEAVGEFRIAGQSTVTARLPVIEHQVEQIPARFPILEQHQTWHPEHEDHKHQEPVHRQEEHVAVREKELTDQHGDCARHRKKEHVLELKTEQSDLGVQIARYRTHSQRHYATPLVPAAMKCSINLINPETQRHAPPAMKCRIQSSPMLSLSKKPPTPSTARTISIP